MSVNTFVRLSDLAPLQEATSAKRDADRRWNEALEAAIRSGFSERAIGEAAGVTGVAIHYRKTKTRKDHHA